VVSQAVASAAALTPEAVWAALDGLCDPEIPVVTLQEMGILRAVHLRPDGVEVVITPTYSGCPAMEHIHDDILSTLRALGVQAQVTTQLAPAWTTDWMTPVAREKLRAYGIAPPAPCASPTPASQSQSGIVMQFARPLRAREVVACPRCHSDNTTETSHFGSTACKALYKCLACMEPFDHFKPY
jgi:ring-1,2-phenylacetyl-CoA epoxidase subunit PaaD